MFAHENKRFLPFLVIFLRQLRVFSISDAKRFQEHLKAAESAYASMN